MFFSRTVRSQVLSERAELQRVATKHGARVVRVDGGRVVLGGKEAKVAAAAASLANFRIEKLGVRKRCCDCR